MAVHACTIEETHDARLESFRRALEAIHRDVLASLGEEDVAYIERLDRWARGFEWTGRGLLYVGFDPVTLGAGTAALFLHKQLVTVELGHNVAHGAYDGVPGGERFHSRVHPWRLPVHLPGWRRCHNGLHHTYTNIVRKDPDARFGTTRLNEQVPHRWHHRFQLLEVGFNWFNLLFNLNLQVTGLVDLYMRRAGDEDVLPDRTLRTIVEAHRQAIAGAAPYLLREYIVFPALAGPFFLKVLAGNWLSSAMRNVFSGMAIYCSHIGDDIADYGADERPRGRAEWMAMQVAATRNYEVPLLVSYLVGGLDYQIEHHLFPRLPANRLREIAPAVRRVCEEHGVPYRSAPWGRTLASALRRVWRLSRPT